MKQMKAATSCSEDEDDEERPGPPQRKPTNELDLISQNLMSQSVPQRKHEGKDWRRSCSAVRAVRVQGVGSD